MTLVIFTSSPNGCYVYMDGFKIGTAPFTTQLDPGQYNFEYRKSGYDTVKKKFVIFAPEVMPAQSIFLSLSKSKEPPPEEEEEPEEEEKEYKVSVISAKAVGKEKLDVDFTVENKGNVRDKFYITIYHTTDPKFDVTETTSYCDPNERDNENFNNISNPYPDRIKYKIKSKKGNKIIKTGTIKSPKIEIEEPEPPESLPSWINVQESGIPAIKNYAVGNDEGTIIIRTDPERQGSLKIDNKNAKQNIPITLIGKEKAHKFEVTIAVHEPRIFVAKFKKGTQRTFVVKMVAKPIPDPLKDWWGFIDHVGKTAMTFFPSTLTSFQNVDSGKSAVGMPLIIPIASVAEDAAMVDTVLGKMEKEGTTQAVKAAPTLMKNLQAVTPKIAKLVGIIAATVGLHSFAEWTAKELPEKIEFSLADLMRNKEWEKAAELLPTYERLIDISSGFMEKSGWMIPFLDVIWEGYAESGRENLAIVKKRIEEGLADVGATEEGKEPGLLVFNVKGPDIFEVSNFEGVEFKYGSAIAVYEGEYKGIIRAPEYESANYTQFVNDGDTKIIDITLKKEEYLELIKVTFKVNVNCEIEVAGYETKNTVNQKAIFDLNAGWFRANFKKSGYKDQTFTFTLKTGEIPTYNIIMQKETVVNDVDVEEPPTETTPPPIEEDEDLGTVFIEMDHVGTIEIGDIKRENITSGYFTLVPGTYDIKASGEGYADEVRTVYLSKGENPPVFIVYSYLLPLPEVIPPEEIIERMLWRIDVNSSPSGGKILIDDQFTGEWTPAYIILNPGTYKVSVVKTGYIPAEKVITLEEE